MVELAPFVSEDEMFQGAMGHAVNNAFQFQVPPTRRR